MKDYTLHLDYWELLNLHKALLEAKFHENPNNELVSGSPLIADVYIQVRDLLIQSNKHPGWEAFFQLKNRPDYKERAMTRMLKDSRWENASDDEKRKITGDYLAPFIYDEGELMEVVAETDSLFREQVISHLPIHNKTSPWSHPRGDFTVLGDRGYSAIYCTATQPGPPWVMKAGLRGRIS